MSNGKDRVGIFKMYKSWTSLFRVAVASTDSVTGMENPESPRLLDWANGLRVDTWHSPYLSFFRVLSVLRQVHQGECFQ